jgi:death-on-curing protein
MTASVFLTLAEVITIHQSQIEQYGGARGIRDQGLLESAVFRPQIGYYNGIAEEAAALMESLGNNQAFMDGNKRTAFASTHTFLLVNGYDLDVDSQAAYEFMASSTDNGTFRYKQILIWINKHLKPLSEFRE